MNDTALAPKWLIMARLMRLDKPIGILLLLWPTLWALWFAGNGHPKTEIIVVFILGVILMRSAGCIINDYADRHIDLHVKRTANRPLTSGQISTREALGLFAALLVAAFVLVLTLNALTILLAFVAALLATTYPFTKRYTHLPQAYLGVAFAWAVPMAFAAQNGHVDPRSWWIFAAVVVWALIYDTIYAMVDRDDDLKIGVKSSAILFGRHDRLIIGLLQMLMLALLSYVGYVFERHLAYYSGLLLAAFLMAYHQWLIRHCERMACFKAFLHNHWIGAIVFLGIVLDYHLQ